MGFNFSMWAILAQFPVAAASCGILLCIKAHFLRQFWATKIRLDNSSFIFFDSSRFALIVPTILSQFLKKSANSWATHRSINLHLFWTPVAYPQYDYCLEIVSFKILIIEEHLKSSWINLQLFKSEMNKGHQSAMLFLFFFRLFAYLYEYGWKFVSF